MISDIVEINDYIVLIEQSNSEKQRLKNVSLTEISFYGSGDVELEITHGKTKKRFIILQELQFILKNYKT